jgi:hypothetical protein
MTYLLPPLWMAEPNDAETITFGHGIVIGFVFVLLLLAALGVWVWRESRQLRRDIEASDAADAAADRPARVIRFKDAAARLGCAVRTVRLYVQQGQLDPVKAKERAIGVTEASLERMINDGINGAADRGGNDRAAGLVPAMA